MQRTPKIKVKEISRRIQQRRQYLQITQQEMARRLSRPVGTYSRWDNGATPITALDMVRIADILGVTGGYLLGEISETDMQEATMIKLFRELPEEHKSAVRAFLLSMHQQSLPEPARMSDQVKLLE